MTHPTETDEPVVEELDVRDVPKPQRHRLIFERFDTLTVGDSFVLVNSHDPKHLRQEFDRDHAGAYSWTYLQTGDLGAWRVKITRRAATGLPRVLADTTSLSETDATAAGAIWRLDPATRQLDANVIRLRPDEQIAAHLGPDVDVLLHVVAGAGEIVTAIDTVQIGAGAIVWLPRRSRRAILASPAGLVYLSVHIRRPGLSITTRDTEGPSSATVGTHGHEPSQSAGNADATDPR